MTSIGSFEFRDADSGESAWAGVRMAGDSVALALSLESDGDIEVVLSGDDCMQLVKLLSEAMARCNWPPPHR